MNILIKLGANVNAVDIFGRTPLMMAALKNKIESVRGLIKAGADVNITDKKGKTALKHASEARHIKIVRELEKAGARNAKE